MRHSSLVMLVLCCTPSIALVREFPQLQDHHQHCLFSDIHHKICKFIHISATKYFNNKFINSIPLISLQSYSALGMQHCRLDSSVSGYGPVTML